MMGLLYAVYRIARRIEGKIAGRILWSYNPLAHDMRNDMMGHSLNIQASIEQFDEALARQYRGDNGFRRQSRQDGREA